jgi:hypothetical protein
MRLHFLAALWAPDSAIQLAPIGLVGRFSRDFAARPQVVDYGDEGFHADQHPTALAAIQHPLARYGSVIQSYCADRTA